MKTNTKFHQIMWFDVFCSNGKNHSPPYVSNWFSGCGVKGLLIQWYRSIFVNMLNLSKETRFLKSGICILPAVWSRQRAVWWWMPSISLSLRHSMMFRKNSLYGSFAWDFGKRLQCPILPCTTRQLFLRKVSYCYANSEWNQKKDF